MKIVSVVVVDIVIVVVFNAVVVIVFVVSKAILSVLLVFDLKVPWIFIRNFKGQSHS
jgi:hypothetical protein